MLNKTFTLAASRQRGFTLMEVMIALVIFSIGLLGLAGLQSIGIRNNQTGFFRTIAMQEAYNMADRLRANVNFVNSGGGGYTFNNPAPAAGTNCITNTCTLAELAAWDYYEWQSKLQNVLPGGNGFITQNAGVKGALTQVIITVAYDENNILGGAAPATCANAKCYQLTVEL